MQTYAKYVPDWDKCEPAIKGAWRQMDGLSPLMKAIEAHILTPESLSSWNNKDFSNRIAKKEEAHEGPKALYGRTYSGEWHVTNADLEKWANFMMWVNRFHEPLSYDVNPNLYSDIDKALTQKRLSQAWERYKNTGLRKEHCQLLERMLWHIDMGRGDWISLYVEGKRPFGNSSITIDIAEICGWIDTWTREDGDLAPAAEEEERAWEIFDELVFAAPDAAAIALKSLASGEIYSKSDFRRTTAEASAKLKALKDDLLK